YPTRSRSLGGEHDLVVGAREVHGRKAGCVRVVEARARQVEQALHFGLHAAELAPRISSEWMAEVRQRHDLFSFVWDVRCGIEADPGVCAAGSSAIPSNSCLRSR